MRIRLTVAFVGCICIDSGLWFVYRPLSLIFVGVLFLLIARAGSKGK